MDGGLPFPCLKLRINLYARILAKHFTGNQGFRAILITLSTRIAKPSCIILMDLAKTSWTYSQRLARYSSNSCPTLQNR